METFMIGLRIKESVVKRQRVIKATDEEDALKIWCKREQIPFAHITSKQSDGFHYYKANKIIIS